MKRFSFADADAEQARKRRKKAVDTATELAQLEAEVNAIEEASKPQVSKHALVHCTALLL